MGLTPAFAEQTATRSTTVHFTQDCHIKKDVKYAATITFTTTYSDTRTVENITGGTTSINFPKYISHCYIEYGYPPQFESLHLTMKQNGHTCTHVFTSQTASIPNCPTIYAIPNQSITISGYVTYDLGSPYPGDKLKYVIK